MREKHRIAEVLEAFDASLTKGVAQVEERKMAEVLALFDQSLDAGLAKHAEATYHFPSAAADKGKDEVKIRVADVLAAYNASRAKGAKRAKGATSRLSAAVAAAATGPLYPPSPAAVAYAAEETAKEPSLREGDELLTGCTVTELWRVVMKLKAGHPVGTPAPLRGKMAPTNREEADALVAILEEAGGDYREKFACPAYRILTDKNMVWEGIPPGTPVGQVVVPLLNGYDWLEVRVDRVGRREECEGPSVCARGSIYCANHPFTLASRHFDNTSLPQVQRQDPDLSSESHCAHQMRLGNGGAGRADIFISWALVSTMFDLLEAIELYVKEHGLDPSKTMFWICNFSIRQTEGEGKKADVERLGLVVEACKLTVMFLEPWNNANAMGGMRANCLSRIWCVDRPVYSLVPLTLARSHVRACAHTRARSSTTRCEPRCEQIMPLAQRSTSHPTTTTGACTKCGTPRAPRTDSRCCSRWGSARGSSRR